MDNQRRYEPAELHKLFVRVFETDDGKDLKKVLEAKFRAPSMIPMQAADGQAMSNITYMRVGEENVLRWIESMLNYNTSAQNMGVNQYNQED